MRIGRLVTRVWAVAVLVLGILVMHHVARTGHDALAVHEASVVLPQAANHGMGADMAVVAKTCLGGEGTAAGDEVPPTGHDLLHLCLAAMTAAGVALLAGWLLLMRRVWTIIPPVLAFRFRAVLARPPPRPRGSVLLVSLCVMRT